MVRDRGGRGARRGTAVRAGVGRGCGPPPGCSTARRRDERHAAQRRGERRLADVRAQLLEQPVLAPEDDQHHEREESRPAGRLYARREHVGQLRNHADRGGRDHVHHVTRGYVKSFNATTGAPGWTWYTLPSPEDGGWWGPFSKTTPDGDDLKRDIAKERADSAKYADAWKTGGGSMWMTPAYDEASKTLFVAIGNPSPDLDGSIRPGDNRWTESIVAIDATNGKFKWGYQEVPHDVWDLDAVSPPVIAMVGGKKAVVEAGKTGVVYVLDAATGKLIRRSAAFVPQQNMYTQPTADGVFMLPGANGGQEWSPIAVHPELAYAYTVGLHQPMHYKVHYAPWEKGRLWLGSAFIRVPDEKGGYSGEYGLVSAIDLNTGKIAWQQKTELPMMGGATATAGGLVFTGEGNGWFKAYDAKTGTVLWKFYCGAGVNAAPSVYELDGEQFIAVAAGGNFQISYPLGNSVFVFGLPKAGM